MKKTSATIETKIDELENESDLSESDSDDDTHEEDAHFQFNKN